GIARKDRAGRDRRPEGRGHARRQRHTDHARRRGASRAHPRDRRGVPRGGRARHLHPGGPQAHPGRLRPRARRLRDRARPRGRPDHRAGRRTRAAARRVSDPQAPLFGVLRHRARARPQVLRRRDADPARRADRRLRPLHVRRRPPARLPLPGRHRLRRRVVDRGARRLAAGDEVPATRLPGHQRRGAQHFRRPRPARRRCRV
ncbi:MAG: Nicotinamidase/isochorismatase family protein, partial [uncultured Solirubrobacteraceae bacterium]